MSTEETHIVKHSVTLAGHRTSLSLEEAFWTLLRETAEADGKSINALVSDIDAARTGNLSSAVRVYLLKRIREEARIPHQTDGRDEEE